MQSKLPVVTTRRITTKVQADAKITKPGPVELTAAQLRHVAGGRSPNDTWGRKATTELSPNGTW